MVFLNFIENDLPRGKPVFVYDYPEELAALAKVEDGRAKRFEIYWNGVELGNAFFELTSPELQINRFKEEQIKRLGIGKEAFDLDSDFISALQRGLPSCAGIFKKGDKVLALPSGFATKIKSIDTFHGPIDEAFAPLSVTMTLEDEIDISRGDMIVRENNVPQVSQDMDIMVCWMNEKKMIPNGKYGLRHTTKDCRCMIKEVKYKLNVNTLHRNEEDLEIGLNDIARISIRTTSPLFFDSYKRNRFTGSVILVDEGTNETVAAGMII